MTGEGVARALSGLTSLVWTGLAFYIVWLLRASLTKIADRITGFEGWGMKFALSGGEQAMIAAFEIAAKQPRWTAEASEDERRSALDRAKARRHVFEGAEILWVDDHPSNNRNEARMLRSFGALITFACTTEEALSAVKDAQDQAQPFSLILSDIARDVPPPLNLCCGLEMLDRFRAAGLGLPVIFYIGNPKSGAGIPPGAFGITHRPDILLSLVCDALSRLRIR